jgi:hypothetical protein
MWALILSDELIEEGIEIILLPPFSRPACLYIGYPPGVQTRLKYLSDICGFLLVRLLL